MYSNALRENTKNVGKKCTENLSDVFNDFLPKVPRKILFVLPLTAAAEIVVKDCCRVPGLSTTIASLIVMLLWQLSIKFYF